MVIKPCDDRHFPSHFTTSSQSPIHLLQKAARGMKNEGKGKSTSNSRHPLGRYQLLRPGQDKRLREEKGRLCRWDA